MLRRRALASALALAALPAAYPRRANGATGAEPGFAFAVLGDAPYGAAEERAFDEVIDRINADATLAFAVHVGDLKSSREPCSDALLERRLAALRRLTLPWLYTPGDNEWTDCHGSRAGRFQPLERLQFLRRLLFATPERTHGPNAFAVRTQGATPGFAPFVENTRFEHAGVVCACVHIVGSDNGLLPWLGIDRNDRAGAPRADRLTEVRARAAAALAWIDAAFDRAEAVDARAVALFFHANPGLEYGPLHSRRRPFAEIVARLAARAASFARPVLLAHGDLHLYRVDAPFPGLATAVRVQVPGSPMVGWVRVGVPDGRDAAPFFAIRLGPVTAHEPP